MRICASALPAVFTLLPVFAPLPAGEIPKPPEASQTTPKKGASHPTAWQRRRARHWRSEHRDWRARGGYRGQRIPELRYRDAFGQDHPFRIQSQPPRLVGGYPSFPHGGFWISVVDPWPEYWSPTWYDDDDVYIESAEDGYYMRNRQCQQDRICVSLHLQ